ncbi:MAG TPA: XRE family transcriptional regulator [Thermodesulfobacteriaceae bacterium]|nr:XRE family transcriptional regulator [Thermodesulfobacteriaceae bacterium]
MKAYYPVAPQDSRQEHFVTRDVKSDRPAAGSMAMVKIDGTMVRRIRESRGLTQLYIATAVGVTTDTVSRWENRRYPSIKQDNALKLAQALEVTLEEIIENQGEQKEESAARPAKDDEDHRDSSETESGSLLKRRGRGIYAMTALLFLSAAVAVFWWYFFSEAPVNIHAARLLPAHAAPGQSFPVVIRIDSGKGNPVSLILREYFPAGISIIEATPSFTRSNDTKGHIKWIGRTGRTATSFCYLARTAPETAVGTEFEFNGRVTARKGRSISHPVFGSSRLRIEPFHWADSDRDNRIDDEEILKVYDELGNIEKLALEIGTIEKIWSGNGYRWDRNTRSFRVLQQETEESTGDH